MDTDNEPTKNEPQYVTDVDGNQVEKTSFAAAEIEEFGELLISALFGGVIKEDAPPEARQQLLAEMKSVMFLHGIRSFCTDVEKASKDFLRVLQSYSRDSVRHAQDVANSLYQAEKDGEELHEGDAAVLEFLKSKGVVHMPDRSLFGGGDVLEQLKQMAQKMGMPEEVFDRIEGEAQEMSGLKGPTPGCDCPACRAKKKVLAELGMMPPEENGGGGNEEDEAPRADNNNDDGGGTEDAPPPTASL
jgi:hypothetical protein